MRGLTVARKESGYTLIRGAGGYIRQPAGDLLLSDEGVLSVAGDDGAVWRCLGLGDPEEVLDDLGLLDGSAVGLVVEDVLPRLLTPTMM
jgi:hypothetical protein